MKKLSTLFKKDPNDLGRVINEVNPENMWVFKTGKATRKFDGTACAIKNGELYKRYDVKQGREVPENAIPCQEPDEITGHWPHWVKCERNNPVDKWHFVAFDRLFSQRVEIAKLHPRILDGTYELCGEKIQKNPEKIEGHKLIKHGCEVLNVENLTFEGVKTYLETHDIEGIVFHDTKSERMCKIRKSDFGIKRS